MSFQFAVCCSKHGLLVMNNPAISFPCGKAVLAKLCGCSVSHLVGQHSDLHEALTAKSLAKTCQRNRDLGSGEPILMGAARHCCYLLTGWGLPVHVCVIEPGSVRLWFFPALTAGPPTQCPAWPQPGLSCCHVLSFPVAGQGLRWPCLFPWSPRGSWGFGPGGLALGPHALRGP